MSKPISIDGKGECLMTCFSEFEGYCRCAEMFSPAEIRIAVEAIIQEGFGTICDPALVADRILDLLAVLNEGTSR